MSSGYRPRTPVTTGLSRSTLSRLTRHWIVRRRSGRSESLNVMIARGPAEYAGLGYPLSSTGVELSWRACRSLSGRGLRCGAEARGGPGWGSPGSVEAPTMRRPGPSRARSSRRLSGDERAELLRLRAENAEFRMELCSNDPWSWGAKRRRSDPGGRRRRPEDRVRRAARTHLPGVAVDATVLTDKERWGFLHDQDRVGLPWRAALAGRPAIGPP